MEKLGYQFAWGAIQAIGSWGLILLVVLKSLSMVLNYYRVGFDETDDWVNRTRSEMQIYVDHGTGCEYLKTQYGSLTPRLGSDGKQICRKAS